MTARLLGRRGYQGNSAARPAVQRGGFEAGAAWQGRFGCSLLQIKERRAKPSLECKSTYAQLKPFPMDQNHSSRAAHAAARSAAPAAACRAAPAAAQNAAIAAARSAVLAAAP